jgi:sec-independent protein translocase protein TatA
VSLGPAEILVVLVIALIVFGPKRLPEVGRQVGGALRELRKVQDTVQNEIRTVFDDTTPVHHPMEIPPPARAEPDDHGDVDHTDIEDLSGGTFS